MVAVTSLPASPLDRAHTCHWPGCELEVPPKTWGCRTHWYMLPKVLRDKIWATYVPGQEITKTPSAEYVAVAGEAQRWISAHYSTLV